jgi:hypothetical protein
VEAVDDTFPKGGRQQQSDLKSQVNPSKASDAALDPLVEAKTTIQATAKI